MLTDYEFVLALFKRRWRDA